MSTSLPNTRLDYNNGIGIVPDGHFRIQPSSFANFFDHTSQWYREKLMDESTFNGSTSTVIGTCMHFMAEQFANGEDIDHTEILQYILNEEVRNSEVDGETVRAEYEAMGTTLINGYVRDNMPTATEEFLFHPILENIGAGGSVDARIGGEVSQGIVIDYKSYRSKSKPRAINKQYWFQLLLYAWLYKQKGITITTGRLVFVNRHIPGTLSEKTNKIGKAYPSEVTVINKEITPDDLDFIESLIYLVTDSVDAWNKMPQLRYLLAQDYRLKTHSWSETVPKQFAFPTTP